jgi:hypothetical protein
MPANSRASRLTIARSMLGHASRDGFSESRPHGIK